MGYLTNKSVDFNKIRELVNAAESLQIAGKDKECHDILKVLTTELSAI